MRRGRRQNTNNPFKYSLYISGGVLIALVVTFIITFVAYNNKLKKASESILSAETITGLVPNTINKNIAGELEETSLQLGKTIEEAKNETITNSVSENSDTNTQETTITEVVKPKVVEEVKKELKFVKPVEGEIIKEFTKDNLIFSETLQEWTTHLGVDIKAERTTVVKASEEGTVTAIKNDPRYGLTVIVEHIDGYKTIYSNLLTSEFITQGEKVKKGQSIGTVGNSAAFEIADEPHLHFEILLNNENVAPTIYM